MTVRKHQVENHQVERLATEGVHCSGARFGMSDQKTFKFKVEDDALGDVLFVFDEEDAWFRHEASVVDADLVRGRVILKVVPWPWP